MTCEEVRPLLSELAEGELREAGPVEAHVASCAACSAELERYRMILRELAALREDLVEPADGFLERILALAPASRWRVLSRRVATDRRVRVAAGSVGGLLVGVAAISMVRRRAARRAPSSSATADAV